MFEAFLDTVFHMVFTNFLKMIVAVFFRDVHTRGQHRIPKKGAVIFVAAPHANQFVDPLIVMNNCLRDVGFLIAQKSLDRAFVGRAAKAMHSIGVVRPQDIAKAGVGTVCIPDEDKPTVVKGIDTKFKTEVKVTDSISLAKGAGVAEVSEIISDTEIVLRRPFASDDGPSLSELKNPRTFKIQPKVDQSALYSQVFKRLADGGCIGIFPEGGSHDRTELLPLKAGVTLMALGAMAENPGLEVTIVPCGLNYFHAHKFRSQACLFFGEPLSIPSHYVDMFKEGGAKKREACGTLLDAIYTSLTSVTINAEDYESLQVLQAVRRLYQPKDRIIPTAEKIALTVRIQAGYDEFKNLPQVQETMRMVLDYNRELKFYGLKDHQINKMELISRPKATLLFVSRIFKIILFVLFAIPGLIINAPVGIISKYNSHKKAKEAVASSTVKIAGRDVLATWKVMTALGLGFFTMFFYSALVFVGNIFYGVPFSTAYFRAGVCFFAIPIISYTNVRFIETGLDILRSIKPLWYVITGNDVITTHLSAQRQKIKGLIVEIIDILAPKVYPAYDPHRYVSQEERENLHNTLVDSPSLHDFYRTVSEITPIAKIKGD